MFALLVILGYLLSRAPERMIHHINKKAFLMRDHGVVKHPVIKLYYSLDLLLPLFVCLVLFFLPEKKGALLPASAQLSALLFLYAGALLRLWSLISLGGLFSLECIWLNNVAASTKGPYKWLKHPDFLGRFLEGCGFIVCVLAPSGYAYDGVAIFAVTSLVLVRYMVKLEKHCQKQANSESVLQSAVS